MSEIHIELLDEGSVICGTACNNRKLAFTEDAQVLRYIAERILVKRGYGYEEDAIVELLEEAKGIK